MPAPFSTVPVINTANFSIAKADVPAFLAAIAALNPPPASKTPAQIKGYRFTTNPQTGVITGSMDFSQ